MSNTSEVIDKLQDRIRELEEYVEIVQDSPSPYATVLSQAGTKVVISTGNGMRVIAVPKKVQVKRGDGLVLLPNGAYSGTTEPKRAGGHKLASVSSFLPGGRVECEEGQGKVVAFLADGLEVSKGDRVLLDESGRVIVATLGKESTKHALEHDTNVSWADIGGQDKAKAALREAIELPSSCPDILEHYSQKPCNALCLYGPPGNGKTLLAKAAATGLSALQGGSRGGFFYIKGPEILSKWVGESEQGIREVFNAGRDYAHKTGVRPILFIDEVDAIAGNRNREGGVSGMERTIVPQLLSEMDGLDSQGPLVILATNRMGSLDPALLREGRCDVKVEVARPTKDEAFHIFSVHLAPVPVIGTSISTLAKEAAEHLYDPENIISKVQFRGKKVDLAGHHVASGAMIAGIVRAAKSRAISRDLKEKTKSGLCAQDLWSGMKEILDAQKHVDHSENLAAMGEK
jgi:proteasome-associated ATPase